MLHRKGSEIAGVEKLHSFGQTAPSSTRAQGPLGSACRDLAASPSPRGLGLLRCCDVLQQHVSDLQELADAWASPPLLYLLCCLFCRCCGRKMIWTSLWAAWRVKHKDWESCCKGNRNN